LKNQPNDQLATKVPISGVYTNSNVDVATTIGELLRNAFIRALLPKYDKEVTTGEVTKKLQKGEIPGADKQGDAKMANGQSKSNEQKQQEAETETNKLKSEGFSPDDKAVANKGSSDANKSSDEKSPSSVTTTNSTTTPAGTLFDSNAPPMMPP